MSIRRTLSGFVGERNGRPEQNSVYIEELVVTQDSGIKNDRQEKQLLAEVQQYQLENRSREQQALPHDDEILKHIRNNLSEDDSSERLKQELMYTEEAENDPETLPASKRPSDHYDFSEENQGETKFVVRRNYAVSTREGRSYYIWWLLHRLKRPRLI